MSDMAQWREITSLDEWKQVLESSANKPVLVMKHSTTCPISAHAWKEFRAYLDGDANEQAEYVMVKVIESRPVSNQIAADLNVVHESPQLILLQDKKATWNTSHWKITEKQIRSILSE